MKDSVYLTPLFIRIWHGINALVIIILIITGISLQYTSPDQGFIPFEISIQIHNICGIVMLISYFIFFFGNVFKKNRTNYRFGWKGSLSDMAVQARHYAIGMFKHEKPPFPIGKNRKFNPLQTISYTYVMYIFVPLALITGLALMFPEIIIIRKIFNYSSILFTAIIHIISGFIVSIFLIIHVYMCSFGIRKYNTFKSILTGWHHVD